MTNQPGTTTGAYLAHPDPAGQPVAPADDDWSVALAFALIFVFELISGAASFANKRYRREEQLRRDRERNR